MASATADTDREVFQHASHVPSPIWWRKTLDNAQAIAVESKKRQFIEYLTLLIQRGFQHPLFHPILLLDIRGFVPFPALGT